MKSVAPDALGGERARQCEGRSDRRLRVMERGVEAGKLRQSGVELGERRNGSQVVRFVERRQRNEAAHLVDHRRIDANRRGVECAAMHHAMSGRDKAMVLEMGFQPAQQRGQRVLVSGAFSQIPVGQRGRVRSFAVKCTRWPMPSQAPSHNRPWRLGSF